MPISPAAAASQPEMGRRARGDMICADLERSRLWKGSPRLASPAG